MKRVFNIAVVLALAASLVSVTGCTRRVKVKTGERVVCTYGEVVTDTVREIEVPESEASKYTVTDKTITCDRHLRLEALYASAQKALASLDTSAAATTLAQVLALDPAFRQAATQLADIRAGKKPKPDTGLPASTPPPASKPGTKTAAPRGPMDNYRYLVPDTFAGFKAEPLTVEEASLSRAYVPNDRGRYDQLIVMAQQYQSSGAAQGAIRTVIKPAYPASGSDVTVKGFKGYFGVNGQRFAVLSVDKGGVLVSFELHATGATPASLKSDLQTLASRVL